MANSDKSKVDLTGKDSDGTEYKNIDEMWNILLEDKNKNKKFKKNIISSTASANKSDNNEVLVDKIELSTDNSETQFSEAEKRWYSGGAAYWNNEEASMKGMLGGLTQVHKIDTTITLNFIESLKGNRNLALDCGAGIGRVTENALGLIFKKVDLVEQNEKYLNKAKELLGEKKYIGDFYCYGLQEFKFPADKKYDIIWIQWVFPHLTDDDIINFLIKCKASLSENGYICAKENICRYQGFYLDKNDFSVTRSNDYYTKLFLSAGLEIAREKVQPGFPKSLYPVNMWAMR